jgi:hypothetical protein
MAAAKANLQVVDVDTNITDVNDIRQFLKLSNAKLIYFYPQLNDVNYIKLLRKSIPEYFHCKHFTFPNLLQI